nr:UPF0146 family protein [Haloarchaeobius iranensis]
MIDRLARFERVVEVGIGNRTDVAAGLAARGVAVTATDVRDCPVPDGVRFLRDDVTGPDPSVYASADAVYALNCPPELQRAVAAVARGADAACLLTTLGGDPTTLPVTQETIPGDTLFVVDTDAPGAGRRRGRGGRNGR